jgi:hypothetical protein
MAYFVTMEEKQDDSNGLAINLLTKDNFVHYHSFRGFSGRVVKIAKLR